MSDYETFWLNLTNIGLGLVTLICFFAFGRVVYAEVKGLLKGRVRVPVAADAHELRLSDLGITMADGGEVIDEKTLRGAAGPEGNESDDPNIVRSDN